MGDLIISVQMAGLLVGAVITGQLADLVGRKKVLFGEYFLLIVFWFCTGFAGNWQMYAALRFFVGALSGGECCTGCRLSGLSLCQCARFVDSRNVFQF